MAITPDEIELLETLAEEAIAPDGFLNDLRVYETHGDGARILFSDGVFCATVADYGANHVDAGALAEFWAYANPNRIASLLDELGVQSVFAEARSVSYRDGDLIVMRVGNPTVDINALADSLRVFIQDFRERRGIDLKVLVLENDTQLEHFSAAAMAQAGWTRPDGPNFAAAADTFAGLADRLAEALRLTQEYIGEELLPELPGFSWYDALTEYRAIMALHTDDA